MSYGNNTIVSIIVPIYNVESYILSCIQSIANQTANDGVECILVDDCGNDNSISIAESFIDTYQGPVRFKLLRHKHNRGLSAARNTGICASNGIYILLLDSDDILTPNCIKDFLVVANKYDNIEFVQGSYTDVKDLKKFWSIPFPEYTEDKRLIKTSMLDYDIIPVNAQNRLVRRSFILEHNLFFPEGIIHEDNYWSFFLAKYVSKMAYCRIPTYTYTFNPNSITTNRNMENEYKSFAFLIDCFCHNIDHECVGSQKMAIILLLLNMRNGLCYRSASELNNMEDLVCKQCNLFEKLIVRFCMATSPNNMLYKKALRFLIRMCKWKDQKWK